MNITLDKALDEAILLVKEAGELLLQEVDDSKIVTKSGTANFVTEIDFKVQEKIVKRLLEILPQSEIIAEEKSANKFKLGKYTWILDPVDGTTNLMYGFKYSVIALALAVDGEPYAGIVYNPYLREMFTARKGQGAFVNGKPIGVTTNQKLCDSLITFGTCPYNREKADDTFRVTKEIFLKCRDIRRTGSAAMDICNVAAGRIDGFYEMILQPWDYAASAIILNESGGRITDWDGNDIDYVSKTAAIATNGLIHDELMKIVNS